MSSPLALSAALALLSLSALAGCSDATPAEPAPPPEMADEEPSPVPSPSAAPEQPQGRLDASVQGESRTNFDLTGCLNPRMLFILEPARAQALLPPGFVAADVTALTQFTG